MLKGRKIIVGISGGISAYKSPLLVRLLVKAGAEVRCVATEHALQFVTPLTLETLSGFPLYQDLFAPTNAHSTEHISLKDWGDAMVVAPATANVIGKMAGGLADDALSTLLVSFARKPILLAPAMNVQMWEAPMVQRNLAYLQEIGVAVADPGFGELACGATGKGRMAEPEEIVLQLDMMLGDRSLAGKRVMVTAGPTYERIDAVRFVGNFSTGKMGFAIAEALALHGAEVLLVAGPTALSAHHPGICRRDVVSAQEMFDVCTREFPNCHAAVLSAAVADFRPDHAAEIKIKKTNDSDGMHLDMVQNPDILATLGREKRADQCLVGFALETNNELEHARRKLERKNLDFIVLNSLQDKGAGFGHDTNKVTFLSRNGAVEVGTLKSKSEVAEDVVAKIAAFWDTRS